MRSSPAIAYKQIPSLPVAVSVLLAWGCTGAEVDVKSPRQNSAPAKPQPVTSNAMATAKFAGNSKAFSRDEPIIVEWTFHNKTENDLVVREPFFEPNGDVGFFRNQLSLDSLATVPLTAEYESAYLTEYGRELRAGARGRSIRMSPGDVQRATVVLNQVYDFTDLMGAMFYVNVVGETADGDRIVLTPHAHDYVSLRLTFHESSRESSP